MICIHEVFRHCQSLNKAMIAIFALIFVMMAEFFLPSTGTCDTQQSWNARSEYLRKNMCYILSLPDDRVPLETRTHRVTQGDGYRIESVTYASEPGSRITATLYLPDDTVKPVPAIVIACGHGGSKSGLYAQYAGQLYARLGFACLIPDTIGEEEREKSGRMGARGHDLYHLGTSNPVFVRQELGRLVLGKIVLDLIRSIDYLESRGEVDSDNIGIAGYSLGGTSAGCTAIVDDRVRAAVLRIWYASRTAPPHVNKYFAIGTALLQGFAP